MDNALMAPAAQDLAVLLTTRDTDEIITPAIERRILTRPDSNELLIQGMAGAGKSTLLAHLAWWWQRTGLVNEAFTFDYAERAYTATQIVRDIRARLLSSADQARADLMPWPAQLNPRHTHPLPFPSEHAPANLVMARLGADPDMQSTLGSADIALLDTSPIRPSALAPEGLFVVERGKEAVIRLVRPGAYGYYLATDSTLDTPADWEPFPVTASELVTAVKARVRWIGSDAIPQRGRFLYDPISS